MATVQGMRFKSHNILFTSDSGFGALLTLIFLSLGLIGIINHEMWRDELQAWLIARDSSSIGDLLQDLRYEGHPGLWYICLYVISRITHNPVFMQILHLIIAVGFIYVFVRFSPFNKTQKILFSFGYFPFYEYSIISRSYALGVLLIFLSCALFRKRDKNFFLLFLVLSLLANTSAYGLIIATCFAAVLTTEYMQGRLLLTKSYYIYISLFIFTIGIITAIIQMIPPSDGFTGDFITSVQSSSEKTNVERLVRRIFWTFIIIWKGYVPIPNFFNDHFWGTNILTGSTIGRAFALFFSLWLFIFSFASFIRKPLVLLLYLSTNLGILLFSYFFYHGFVRHHGHLFIILMACIWISSYYNVSYSVFRWNKIENMFFYRYRNVFLTVILCANVIAGVFAFNMDLLNPFSASKEASNFIQDRGLANMIIVGSKDDLVMPLSALLNKKIYYPNEDKFGSFEDRKGNETPLTPEETLTKVGQIIAQENSNILLVLSYKLNVSRPDMNITPLQEFDNSIQRQEKYYLYLVQKIPATSAVTAED